MSKENKKSITTPDDMELLLRIREQSPILFDRVMELLNIVDDRKRRTADDVEFQVIDTLRNMGKDVLTSWSEKQAIDVTTDMLDENSELKRSSKKKSIGKQPMEK